MSGKLYIIATPIGNFGDISARAIETLKLCEIIAAEDTLNSQNLLNKFEIKVNKLISNHKFNEKSVSDYLIREILDGKNVAVISDAGTPCISDPGGILVKNALENGINVEAIPGACAFVSAASISGFELANLSFMGFFPREMGEIKKLLHKIKSSLGVYIFYESPKRIVKTCEILVENFSTESLNRSLNLCLCNDLTKKFERIYRGKAYEVLKELQENKSAEKGEYTLVLEVIETLEASENLKETEFLENLSANISKEALIFDTMLKNSCDLKTAIKLCAEKYNISRNEIYAASLKLKQFLS